MKFLSKICIFVSLWNSRAVRYRNQWINFKIACSYTIHCRGREKVIGNSIKNNGHLKKKKSFSALILAYFGSILLTYSLKKNKHCWFLTANICLSINLSVYHANAFFRWLHKQAIFQRLTNPRAPKGDRGAWDGSRNRENLIQIFLCFLAIHTKLVTTALLFLD